MYPHTKKTIEINNKKYQIYAPTLGFKSILEDENQEVTYQEILSYCSNIPPEIQGIIPIEQVEGICRDVMQIGATAGAGVPTKAINIIARLINKGHHNPQEYRIDFVQIIFEEMQNGR